MLSKFGYDRTIRPSNDCSSMNCICSGCATRKWSFHASYDKPEAQQGASSHFETKMHAVSQWAAVTRYTSAKTYGRVRVTPNEKWVQMNGAPAYTSSFASCHTHTIVAIFWCNTNAYLESSKRHIHLYIATENNYLMFSIFVRVCCSPIFAHTLIII